MNNENLRCKRCLLQEAGDQAAYADVADCIARLSARDKVTEQVYRQRMDICRECEQLMQGTCLLCGCYVELRGAMRTQCCPAKPRRWDRVKA